MVRKSVLANPPLSLADAHALGRLGFDSVTGVTSLVEAVHRTIASLAPPLGAAPQGGAGGISGFVYSTVRGVTRLAGGGWKAVGTLLPEAGGKIDPRREAWVAAINGVWGEHLHRSGNPLAIAAAHAVLDVIEEEQLCDRANQLGNRLKQRLEAIRADVPHIMDIRGLGFMNAVEFKVPGTDKPNADFTNAVRLKALEKGLILLTCGVYSNVIRFLAPITIQDEVFNEALDLIEASIREVAAGA